MKRIVGSICVIVLGVLLFVGVNQFQEVKTDSNTASGSTSGNHSNSNNSENRVSILDFDLSKYVKLGDYKNLVTEVKSKEISEEYITEIINQSLERYPEYSKTDKTVVKEGDLVNINYRGTLDGEAFEGGTAQEQHLEIGSNSFIEGFENGLINVKVGETVNLNLSFPDNYPNNPDLAGKAVVFEVKVNSIDEEKIYTNDDITDDFVKDNIGYETVEEFRDSVKEYLQESTDKDKESNTRTSVVDAVLAISEVEVPKALLTGKVNEYVETFKNGCEEAGQDFEEQVKISYGTTVDEFQKEIETMMEKSLKEQMVLYSIAQAEGVSADEEGFNEYINAFVNYYQYEDKEALFRDYPEKELNLAYVCNMIVDYLVENSEIHYVEE